MEKKTVESKVESIVNPQHFVEKSKKEKIKPREMDLDLQNTVRNMIEPIDDDDRFKVYQLSEDFSVSFKIPNVYEYGLYLKWLTNSIEEHYSSIQTELEISIHAIAFHLVLFGSEQIHELADVNFLQARKDAERKSSEIMNTSDDDEQIRKAGFMVNEVEEGAFDCFNKNLEAFETISQGLLRKIVKVFKEFNKEYLLIPYYKEDNAESFKDLDPNTFFFNPGSLWNANVYGCLDLKFSIPTVREMRIVERVLSEETDLSNYSVVYAEHLRSIYYLASTLRLFNMISFIPEPYFKKTAKDLEEHEIRASISCALNKINALPLPIMGLIEASRVHLEEVIKQMENDEDGVLKN